MTTTSLRERKGVMFGLTLSDRSLSLLTLYAARHQQTKATVLRRAVLWWLEEQGLDRETLIQELAAEYQTVWYKEKPLEPDSHQPRFGAFRTKVRKELTKKRVPKEDVDAVLELLKI